MTKNNEVGSLLERALKLIKNSLDSAKRTYVSSRKESKETKAKDATKSTDEARKLIFGEPRYLLNQPENIIDSAKRVIKKKK